MQIEPVAIFRSPMPEKFGIPRQAGLVPELRGKVVLCGKYARPEALRGLDGFDYAWLVWGFDRNSPSDALTVRPPRLGGNERVGVFASRSPFRPNGLGLSSVRISRVDCERCEIEVLGADLADLTPVYDIKPYVTYADSHPEARSGFVDETSWNPLEVEFPEALASVLEIGDVAALKAILAQDPRPRYQADPTKIYGLSFAGHNIKFRVSDRTLTVTEIEDPEIKVEG